MMPKMRKAPIFGNCSPTPLSKKGRKNIKQQTENRPVFTIGTIKLEIIKPKTWFLFLKSLNDKPASKPAIVVFNKQAENLNRYIRKGGQVGVEGRIQTRSYDDNQGLKRFITEIIADNVYFLESKGQGEEDAQMKPQSSKDDEDFNYSDVSISEENDLPF